MPVRIYDIAKKLGIENKEVLTKAKELGISSARVPSSSLDKITAEYLESHLRPALSEAPSAPAAAVVTPPPPVVLISAPVEPEPVASPEDAKTFSDTPVQPFSAPFAASAPGLDPADQQTAVAPAAPFPPSAHIVSGAAPAAPPGVPPASEPPLAAGSTAPSAPPEVPAPPQPPLPPPGPRLGELVGRIVLPTRPAPRGPDKGGPGLSRPPARGITPAPSRPEYGNNNNRGRMDPRGGRGPQGPMSRPGQPGFRPVGSGGPPPPAKPAQSGPVYNLPEGAHTITLKPPIIVRELAEQLKKKPFQLIADLMEFRVMANVNQAVDENIAQRLCAKYGYRFEVEKRERGGGLVHAPKRAVEADIDDKPEDLKPRAPVVTIMGHVDHGKTTLLDAIRQTNVASGEAGGITQHIGAYTISFPHPERKEEAQQITFLDTPGHAAFSAMRARGANVTDIVVLVVAANDGVMPQTLEALSHAQAAKVPIIVAVNKCDHPNANVMKVRQQLQEKGLVPDDWGGNTTFVEVSALTKSGVPHLLEILILQAELMELKANPTRRAKGNIIESGLDPGGPTATVLVRKGTLKVGDVLICGQYWGKVRALINEENKRLKEAGPSVAVKVLGLNGVPEAGLEFTVMESDKVARELAANRVDEAKVSSKEARAKITLENLFDTLADASAKTLRLVVKADTQGSVEAIVEALKKIETEKVSLEIIGSAVGTITESDVLLASASKGIILGFHTRIDNGVSDVAKREGVQIKLYSIIYELIDEVVASMAGMLDPVVKETVIGAAEVKKVFELSKGGNVAGCIISHGRVLRGKVRIMRRKGLIYEGQTLSLRRFQDEVNEVRAGMDCGIRIDGFNDFQIGDMIEAYTVEKIAAKL